MCLLTVTLYEFGQFLRIILWIFLPVTMIAMLITTYIHYRRKKKQKEEDEQGYLDEAAEYSEALAGSDSLSLPEGENAYKGMLWMKDKYEQFRDQSYKKYERLKEDLNKSEKKYLELLIAKEDKLQAAAGNKQRKKENTDMKDMDENSRESMMVKNAIRDLMEEKDSQIGFLQNQLEQRIKNYHLLEYQGREDRTRLEELEKQQSAWQQQQSAWEGERDEFRKQADQLKQQREESEKQQLAVQERHKELQGEHEGLKGKHLNFQVEYERLKGKHEEVSGQHEEVMNDHKILKDMYKGLRDDFETLKGAHHGLQCEQNVLKGRHKELEGQYKEVQESLSESRLKLEESGKLLDERHMMIEGLKAQLQQEALKSRELLEKLVCNSRLLMGIYKELDNSVKKEPWLAASESQTVLSVRSESIRPEDLGPSTQISADSNMGSADSTINLSDTPAIIQAETRPAPAKQLAPVA